MNVWNTVYEPTESRLSCRKVPFLILTFFQKQDRKKVREVLCGAFEKFEGELAGKFYDLGTMSDEDRTMLLNSGFLFQIPKTTNLLWHAGAAKNWPTVRQLTFSGWQVLQGAVRIGTFA